MTDTNDMRRDFEAWYYEIENVSMRCERLHDLSIRRDAFFAAWQAATERATASQWQPIETAPMHQIVLVNVVGAGVTFGSRIGSCGWTWEELDDEPADAIVSHWMPLPTPPAIRQGGDK